MTALAPDTLLVFLDATATLRVAAPACPEWLRARVEERDGGCCWHCGAAARRTSMLFSPLLGGTRTDANTVLCCDRCRARMCDVDPMSGAWSTDGMGWSKAKSRQRFDALADCLQHALPRTSRTSLVAARASLEKLRWPHPRVPIAVLSGTKMVSVALASTTPTAPWGSLSMLAKSAGAVVSPGAPTVLSLPAAHWSELAWSMIDQGALLREVLVNGEVCREEPPAHAPGKPAGSRAWSELFQGVRSAVRGREPLPRSGFRSRYQQVD